MQRCIATFLLLCVAALSALQAAPLRRCNVQKTVHIAGFDDHAVTCCAAHVKGCGKCCADTRQSPRSGEDDECCTAAEPLPDYVAANDVRLPATVWLLVECLSPLTVGWVDPFANRHEPVTRPLEPIPIAPVRRRAVLNIWTL